MDFANIPIKLMMTIFVIIFFLGSIAFFSYLGVSFDTDGTSVLKRSAVFEGLSGGNTIHIKTPDGRVVTRERREPVRTGEYHPEQHKRFQIKARLKLNTLEKRKS